MVILEALKSINDFELELSVDIFDNSDFTKSSRIKENPVFKLKEIRYEYVIEKLKTLLIVEVDEGGYMDMKTGWGAYKLTEIAEEFYEVIKDSGYYDKYKKMMGK